MLKAEERMEVDVLRRHGASIRELAKATGRSRNTVRRYLRGGEAAATRKPAPRRPEKLDPFKDYIIERLKAAAPDRIPASVLFREVRDRGYDGGETRVHRDARVEPGGLCRVLRRRARREPARRPRERVPQLRRGAARGPLRQHEDGRHERNT